MKRHLLLMVAVLATGRAAAATPGPDPRLEFALNTNAIAPFERAVEFSKTLPPPARVRNAAVDSPAIRVYGRDRP